VVGIIVSLAVVAAGAWLVLGQNASEMGAFGAMLLVLGAIFLTVNLALRRHGFRMRRRRRP
jgi:hypothetical protein